MPQKYYHRLEEQVNVLFIVLLVLFDVNVERVVDQSLVS